MTGAEALAQGIRRLREAGVPDAAIDARRLLAYALDLPAGRLTLHLSDDLPQEKIKPYILLLHRRASREPVSRLTGGRLFWGREFVVTSDVLDPRPETEVLVAAALEEAFARVLDLGTGSGCLLVTLLAEAAGAVGLGLDLSPGALAVARVNAARHGVGDRAAFAVSDWLAGAVGRFDLVVANPPYLALAEMAGLEPEVRDWEPRMALTDEGDGLGAYRSILGSVRPHLLPGARVVLEVGPGQADAVLALGLEAGLTGAETRPDLDGRRRACVLRARL